MNPVVAAVESIAMVAMWILLAAILTGAVFRITAWLEPCEEHREGVQ